MGNLPITEMSASQKLRLARHQLRRRGISGEDDDEKDNCCICLEPLFSSNQQLHHMRCHHCIHLSCYEQLLQYNRQSSCPICREAIFESNQEDVSSQSTSSGNDDSSTSSRMTSNDSQEESRNNDERVAQLELRLQLLRNNQVQVQQDESPNYNDLASRLDSLSTFSSLSSEEDTHHNLESRLALLHDDSSDLFRSSNLESRLARLRDDGSEENESSTTTDSHEFGQAGINDIRLAYLELRLSRLRI